MTENTVTEWTVLDEAHTALRTVVRGLTEADLLRPTPCAEWTVAQVIQHAAGDQVAYAAFLTGGPGPEENPFAPSGTLAEPAEAVIERATTAAAAAWATVPADTAEVSVPIPPNKLTAEMGVGACALDAAVHAWDLAVASGQPSPLTPELARRLLPVAHTLADPLRGFAFAEALSGNDSGDVDALLRYLGRDPEWQA
ncbi:TIGR03086 family metal-binding protein [Nocardia blacklockiae]|uniref:TIGR03086 family metal-binding protein n=1 Tax=Nocardia blacklockiae TaxID=480036 RepID=UPI0018933FF5|nr:TIGR03086 family metal-binding protein [Nocardia blacklockiae]MBF6175052.1 TIGR03086 family protein [Nocardia blacklockiae]